MSLLFHCAFTLISCLFHFDVICIVCGCFCFRSCFNANFHRWICKCRQSSILELQFQALGVLLLGTTMPVVINMHVFVTSTRLTPPKDIGWWDDTFVCFLLEWLQIEKHKAPQEAETRDDSRMLGSVTPLPGQWGPNITFPFFHHPVPSSYAIG